jgi:hypothetical protein
MRRYVLRDRPLPDVIDKSKKYCNKLACDYYNVTNNNLLAIKILNDESGWENAYTITVSGLPAVILPVKDMKSTTMLVLHQAPFLGVHRNILISSDHTGNFYTESILLLPDSPIAFTGNIIPDPWFINSLNRPYCATFFAEDAIVKNSTKVIVPAKSVFDNPDTIYGVNSGDVKIRDIKDYLKCFDNNPSTDHIYELMVCVQQPEPGTRKPWGLGDKHSGNPVDVGHTFLVATEKTPFKTIVRNVGFYPSSFVWPYGPSAQGMLNNDSYHDFNIALCCTTTSHQFTQVLNALLKGNNPGYEYNLNSNNCTTFILDAMREGEIILPRTIGTWTNGKGLNPGDLGEDIRKFKLLSGMKRFTSDQPHPNQGSCV